jgi:F-type H+-transporting ATPase subunit b
MGFLLLAWAGNSIQLVPDGTLILHGIIIILMVVVLNKTLFKPINRILEERERRTGGLLSEAAQTAVTIDESLRRYEQTLRAARAEGYQMLERQRTEAMRDREREIATARQVLTDQTAVEKERIKAQADVARSTLENEAKKTALKITSHILGRPATS